MPSRQSGATQNFLHDLVREENPNVMILVGNCLGNPDVSRPGDVVTPHRIFAFECEAVHEGSWHDLAHGIILGETWKKIENRRDAPSPQFRKEFLLAFFHERNKPTSSWMIEEGFVGIVQPADDARMQKRLGAVPQDIKDAIESLLSEGKLTNQNGITSVSEEEKGRRMDDDIMFGGPYFKHSPQEVTPTVHHFPVGTYQSCDRTDEGAIMKRYFGVNYETGALDGEIFAFYMATQGRRISVVKSISRLVGRDAPLISDDFAERVAAAFTLDLIRALFPSALEQESESEPEHEGGAPPKRKEDGPELKRAPQEEEGPRAGQSSDSSNDQFECMICTDRPPSTLVKPCGCIVVCKECSDKLRMVSRDRNECVSCRKPIEFIIDLHTDEVLYQD